MTANPQQHFVTCQASEKPLTVYVAGPMRGKKFFNFPAFDDAKEDLESQGFSVISPADLDRAVGFDPEILDGFE